jgi:phosphoribosyl-AMP cyclohydrolase
MYTVYRMAKDEKIWNKGTESGSRWQTAGSFAVDADGVIRWVQIPKVMDDLPDLKEAMKAVGVGK